LLITTKNNKEARETFKKLSMVTERFLGITLDWLGALPYDEKIKYAIIEQSHILNLYPTSEFSRKLTEIAKQFLQKEVDY